MEALLISSERVVELSDVAMLCAGEAPAATETKFWEFSGTGFVDEGDVSGEVSGVNGREL